MARPLCILLWLLMAVMAPAQELKVSLSREQILLGEQTQLQIQLLNLPATQNTYVKSWFAWPKEGNSLELINATDIDTLEEKGRRSLLQSFTLTGFDSGRQALPPMQAVLMVNGVEKTYPLPPLSIEVLPVNISGMKDFHPPKPLLNLNPPQPPWWQTYGLWMAVAALVLIALLFWWWRRPKKATAQPKVLAPPVRYQDVLAMLEKETPAGQDAWRDWAHRLDAAVRQGLEPLTTNEIAVADHSRWPTLLTHWIHFHAPGKAALETYIHAMDPVQFGDRWPAFDQAIIDTVVRPLFAAVEKTNTATDSSTQNSRS